MGERSQAPVPEEGGTGNAGLLFVMRNCAQANPGVIREPAASYTRFAELVVKQPKVVEAVIGKPIPDLDDPRWTSSTRPKERPAPIARFRSKN